MRAKSSLKIWILIFVIGLIMTGCTLQEEKNESSLENKTESVTEKKLESSKEETAQVTEESSELAEETVTEEPEKTEETTTMMQTGPTAPESPIVHSVRLMAVGDNLMHLSNTMSAKQPDGSFDFTYHFQHIAPIIQQADLAVVNQECVMGGIELGIQTYPCFNTVYEVGRDLVKAGFNVILAANNHILDQGEIGLQNMIRYWKTNYPDIPVLGIHETEEDSKIIPVIEKNGIRIAMLNYTYDTNLKAGIEERPYLVDYLEEERIESDIKKAKTMADFIIVFPHWGEEYNDTPTPEVQELAKKMANWGADLIIGAHPHVIEPVEWIPRANDKPTLVYYSLGNFQSEQFRTEQMLGGLADVTIIKDENGDTYVLNHAMEYLVTHYQLTIPNLGYYNIVTAYPWEQYSPELATAPHGIISKDPTFSYEKLDQIRKNMMARCQ